MSLFRKKKTAHSEESIQTATDDDYQPSRQSLANSSETEVQQSRSRFIMADDSTEGEYGLKVIYDPDDPVVDIIFIHGLTGNRETTWTKRLGKRNKCFWPEDLLSNDIANARIATWGYDADVVRGVPFRVVSTNTIQQHAENLCIDLANLRSQAESTHPIAFIVHSMGGLVCKMALLHSAEARTRQYQHIRNISQCTCGIVFLGTPHQGSAQATWGGILASMLGFVKQANVDVVKGLEREAPALTELQRRFYTLLANRREEGSTIEVTCCYEELPVPIVGTIVPYQSAQMVDCAAIGIHADHMGMTKFGGDESPGYVKILGELRRWMERWTAEKKKKESEQVNYSYHTTFSGDNNRGFQLGHNTGTISGFTFGSSQ